MKYLNYFLLLTSFACSAFHANAQLLPPIEWQACFGGGSDDDIQIIRQTVNGGYILAGTTFSSDGDVTGYHGNYDIWVVCLDSNRAIKWQRCLGGSDDEYVNDVLPTADGGAVVAGATKSSDGDVVGFHPSTLQLYGYDAWAIRLDSAGDIQWAKCLGGSNVESFNGVAQMSDGNFMFVGGASSTDGDVINPHGLSEAWLVCLSSNGDLLWKKCYGGSLDDGAEKVFR